MRKRKQIDHHLGVTLLQDLEDGAPKLIDATLRIGLRKIFSFNYRRNDGFLLMDAMVHELRKKGLKNKS